MQTPGIQRYTFCSLQSQYPQLIFFQNCVGSGCLFLTSYVTGSGGLLFVVHYLTRIETLIEFSARLVEICGKKKGIEIVYFE